MYLFETVLKWKGYDLKQAAAEIRSIEALPPADRQAWVQKQCRDIARYHFDHNPFYRATCGDQFPDNWTELPVLTKKHFQRPLADLVNPDMPLKSLYVANTSGSTGNPFYFAKDKFAHALTWANIFRYYQRCGIQSSDLQARFFGIPLAGKSLLIEQIKDLTMNRVRFPVFYLGTDSLAQYHDRFRKNNFRYIYGYTNAIRHFCVFVKNKGQVLNQVCPTLRAVIVTAEMCTEQDRALIASATGVPVYIEYGASETGLIAFSDNDGALKVCDETVFVETTAEKEILVTSFFNKAFPLIRYKIGDMGELEYRPDGTYIKSLIGRSDDLVKLPNGKEAAGLTFYYCTRAILEKSANIREIYFTQKSISTFVINYVSETELSDNDRGLIITNIDKMLQPGLDLIFERVSEIRRKSNGKFQVFTSELPKQ
jgi:phenylacetate-CoA ligase